MFGIKKKITLPLFTTALNSFQWINYFQLLRIYKGGGGGGGGIVVNPLWGFREFIIFFQEDKTSAPDAFSNCSFISRTF